MQRLLVFAALLAGCPGAKTPPPVAPLAPLSSSAPVSSAPIAPIATGTPFESVSQLVPLDAVDTLALPACVARTVEAARARIPERLDDRQVRALEDLESRFEREEAALESAKDRGRLLGAYYWERLRIFAPDLADEPPAEVLGAFERGTARGD